ncbi:hypothetical protein PN499_25775 [Kamptonema animale CS-326]|jgi:hypothetical protein|uniref:hypothetical protein n=1 Tax=Kamptonema animale TaxID=92934 RepID=UPI00232F9193|nr:hypothetical protein [Kamptonema animale]MDB9514614.1 hypothetical protein [Kamptonema animale CS-326]
MITNPTDIKDLLAFIGALSQQESPLPDEIQQQIEQAIIDLETNPKTAIDNLIDIADKFEPLSELYQEARNGLTAEFAKKKRTKVISITLENHRNSDLENAEVENVSLSADALSAKVENVSLPTDALSVEGAKQLKWQVLTQAIQTVGENSIAQPWWYWLNYLSAV